jgi:hypothetical protein
MSFVVGFKKTYMSVFDPKKFFFDQKIMILFPKKLWSGSGSGYGLNTDSKTARFGFVYPV